jgi:hypothetical protein
VHLVALLQFCTILQANLIFRLYLFTIIEMNGVDFEKVRSLFESDDKECLLVLCGEYLKQINSMDARKLSWPKLSS